MYWLKIDSDLVKEIKALEPAYSIKGLVEQLLRWWLSERKEQPAPTDFNWTLHPDEQAIPSQAIPATPATPTKEFIHELVQLIAHDITLRSEVLGSSGLNIDWRIKSVGHKYLPTILPNYIDNINNDQTFPREKFVEFVTKEQVRQSESDEDNF